MDEKIMNIIYAIIFGFVVVGLVWTALSNDLPIWSIVLLLALIAIGVTR